MKLAALLLLLLGLPLVAQNATEEEQKALQEELGGVGSSQVDFIRALERHLRKYPKTGQRPELERALVKAAIETRDPARIIRYGEPVLKQDPSNVELLERVSRHLLAAESKADSEKALGYAQRLEAVVRAIEEPRAGTRGAAQMAEQQRVVLGKALVYQARAQGNLGKLAEAEALARKSYEMFPSAESAREIARWLDKQDKTEQAIPFAADAFMIPDPNNEDTDRAKDRKRLGEWHKKVKGSEAGLGEILLAAYDRTSARVEAHKNSLRKLDPNANATGPMDWTISGLNGEKLQLTKYKGKVVVFDFWATWCGPCRAQQPLYEEVKAKFAKNANVVFLNINTDENRDVVKPFLDNNGWKKTIYFEDGLSALLRVTSIPMTLVIGKRGETTSRMNGYVPEKFVAMLTERIEEALAEN